MKALVYETEHNKLVFKEKNKPVCGPEDMIIKVEAVGICGGDLHFFTGNFQAPPSVHSEFIAGHEFAGVISEVGDKVDPQWKVGDRVVTDNNAGACGKCTACARGHFVK